MISANIQNEMNCDVLVTIRCLSNCNQLFQFKIVVKTTNDWLQSVYTEFFSGIHLSLMGGFHVFRSYKMFNESCQQLVYLTDDTKINADFVVSINVVNVQYSIIHVEGLIYLTNLNVHLKKFSAYIHHYAVSIEVLPYTQILISSY